MAKKVIPTPFDLAVVKVVEYLSSVMSNFSHELPQFENKYQLIDAIGLRHERWSEMVNNYRHVTLNSEKQAAIVGKLHKLFRVDPNYIYHYPHWPKMFVEDPLVAVKPVEELVGKTAYELLNIVKIQQAEISKLKKLLHDAAADLKVWKDLAQLQQENIALLKIAADDGGKSAGSAEDSTANPAKKPAKPTPYKKRKPRK